jgi:hypothetical protein
LFSKYGFYCVIHITFGLTTFLSGSLFVYEGYIAIVLW